MRLVVTGGRDYVDGVTLRAVLDALREMYGVVELAHGDSRGADRLAGHWAETRGVTVKRYPARWDLGKFAGLTRNYEMLVRFRPDAVVAFPGGRGTADCVKRAVSMKIPVINLGVNQVLTDR